MMTVNFSSLEAFALYVDRMARFGISRADIAGRAAAAEDFLRESKNKLGKKELLPPPLAESTVRERERLGYTPDDTLLRSGAMRRSGGLAHTSPIETIVGFGGPAIYHETAPEGGKLPRRSFIASTAKERNEIAFGLYVAAFLATAERVSKL